MNLLTGPCSAIFRSFGKPSQELVYPLVQAVLVALHGRRGIRGLGPDRAGRGRHRLRQHGRERSRLPRLRELAGGAVPAGMGEGRSPSGVDPYLVAGAVYSAAMAGSGAAHAGRGPAIALVLATGTVHSASPGSSSTGSTATGANGSSSGSRRPTLWARFWRRPGSREGADVIRSVPAARSPSGHGRLVGLYRRFCRPDGNDVGRIPPRARNVPGDG